MKSLRRLALGLSLLTLACLGASAARAQAPQPPWIADPGSQCWAAGSEDRAVSGAAPADDAAARSYVWDHRLDLTPMCLFESANEWAIARDAAKAGELFALAKIRARYDVLRCRMPEAEAQVSAMFKTLEARVGQIVRAIGPDDGDWLPNLIRRVVQTDEAFAYDGRRLAAVCKASGPGSRSAWSKARYTLSTQMTNNP